jgi:hypothetical protein
MERAIPQCRSLVRRVAVIGCLLLALFFRPNATGADAPTRAEVASVKAVMTSIILRSAQWPDSAFADELSVFQIGIIGRNPPVKEFNAAFEGVTISGRTVTVVSLKSPEDAVGLQAVYFSEMSEDLIIQTLALLNGRPTLSFGEHDEFSRLGGVVNYRKVDGKLRFEFNRRSMERSGVKVSAQVIRLALPTKDAEVAP